MKQRKKKNKKKRVNKSSERDVQQSKERVETASSSLPLQTSKREGDMNLSELSAERGWEGGEVGTTTHRIPHSIGGQKGNDTKGACKNEKGAMKQGKNRREAGS